MMIKTKITELLNIDFPIIQGGMVWVSGWKLASAVSNNGGLGLIGAGSMKPDLLSEHIRKCKNATDKPFGVNLPLLREDANSLADVIIKENVKIVFTSAGHPGKFIDLFKKHNIIVVHVVSSLKFGKKAESVGCDAVVGEGVEAGGHNGLDEITTFSLVPHLVSELNLPVIAAGGISNGQQILAALSLGADAVQIGTRFAVTKESSAHINYKNAVISAKDNSTKLILKNLGMARVIENSFSNRILDAEKQCKDINQLKDILGTKREKEGIFNGNIDEGMLEASQSSGLINDIPTVKVLMQRFIDEYSTAISKVK